MIKKIWSWFFFLFNVALAVTLLWFLFFGHKFVIHETNSLEYKDLIAIILTALAVMIAVATVVLAALAVWGFAALREEASSRAAREARKVALKIGKEAKERATAVAKEVAETVAARTTRDALPVGTTGPDAESIANAMDGNENDSDSLGQPQEDNNDGA